MKRKYFLIYEENCVGEKGRYRERWSLILN
jgi:hypothetical protein